MLIALCLFSQLFVRFCVLQIAFHLYVVIFLIKVFIGMSRILWSHLIRIFLPMMFLLVLISLSKGLELGFKGSANLSARSFRGTFE